VFSIQALDPGTGAEVRFRLLDSSCTRPRHGSLTYSAQPPGEGPARIPGSLEYRCLPEERVYVDPALRQPGRQILMILADGWAWKRIGRVPDPAGSCRLQDERTPMDSGEGPD
jgi:hypothetical protein